MPSPLGGRVNPDDLAKSVARHLADTAPRSVAASLRDSVLLARVVSGAIVVLVTGTLVLGVFGGVNWLLGRERPEPAAVATFDPESFFAGGDSTTTTGHVVDEVASVGITSPFLAVPPEPTKSGSGGFPVLPSPTTTAPGVTTTSDATATSGGGATSTSSTAPASTSTSAGATTSSSTGATTTSTVPTTSSSTSTSTSTTTTTTTTTTSTTSTSTTTTTTTIPTTTTVPVTTTTIPTTTTTE